MNKIIINKLENLDDKTSEAYKTLRSNIRFCGDSIKTIAVTSTLEGEGKSEVSLQLAKSMAEAGMRVVYLDVDMRKTPLWTTEAIDNKLMGLSHYLTGQSQIVDVLYTTNIHQLYVIFSGPTAPNPVELLDNKKFIALVKSMREICDYIIIDCPPLGNVIDAVVVAKICDGTLIVVENNRVKIGGALKIKKQLDNCGTKILGCIYNKV